MNLNMAFANNPLAVATVTMSGGGLIEINSIFANNAAPLTCVNFNNGTLKAFSSANLLGANLDGVFVHAGGATIDSAGFNVSAVPQLQTPSGNGITAVAMATAGAGYIGRPIVRISDSTGIGATAIADWSEALGTVTGITITCPGSGYTAPTLALVGGGYTNIATLGAVTLGAVPAAGGLTKTGNGALTLIGGYNYTGPTVVSGGTLSLLPNVVTPSTAGSMTINNAGLTVDTSSGNPLPVGSLTLQNNATNTFNYGTLSLNPTAPAINASGSLSAPGTGLIINISGFGLQQGQFPLIKYTGAALGSIANFSLGALPPGVVANLSNNVANLSVDLVVTGTGQNLSWYGLLPDGVTVSNEWNINLTTNWVTVGSSTPALRYQEYTAGGNTVGDPVTLDDSVYTDGINPQMTNINLTATVRPFQFVVNNTLPYSLTGTDRKSVV